MKNKKIVFLWFLVLFSLGSYSQKFNFTIGNSNIYFNQFNYRKVNFHGVSFSADYYFKRFGWSFDLNYYFPKTYYGQLSRFPVYIKAYSILYGPGLKFKVFVSKSQKTIIQAVANIYGISFNGTYNTEPIIRIYGGFDNVSDTYVLFSPGIKFTKKIRYIPISISVRRNFNLTNNHKYEKMDVKGFTELNVGISFPVIFGPAPNSIKKINY